MCFCSRHLMSFEPCPNARLVTRKFRSFQGTLCNFCIQMRGAGTLGGRCIIWAGGLAMARLLGKLYLLAEASSSCLSLIPRPDSYDVTLLPARKPQDRVAIKPSHRATTLTTPQHLYRSSKMPVHTSHYKRVTKRPDRQPRKKSGHVSEWSWECCSCPYDMRMLISATFSCFGCGHIRCPDCPAGSIGLKARSRPRRSALLGTTMRCSRNQRPRYQSQAAFIAQLLSPEEVVRALSCSNLRPVTPIDVVSGFLEVNILAPAEQSP